MALLPRGREPYPPLGESGLEALQVLPLHYKPIFLNLYRCLVGVMAEAVGLMRAVIRPPLGEENETRCQVKSQIVKQHPKSG